jgi:hypothetical protein
MQISSTHLDDTVDEERSSNYELKWSNWIKVLKSGKLREVETLWYKLKLVVLVASMHSHDGAEVMKIGNWMKEVWFESKLELGWTSQNLRGELQWERAKRCLRCIEMSIYSMLIWSRRFYQWMRSEMGVKYSQQSKNWALNSFKWDPHRNRRTNRKWKPCSWAKTVQIIGVYVVYGLSPLVHPFIAYINL